MSLKLASLTEADVSLPVLPGVAVGILDEGSLEVPDGQGTSEVSVLPQRDTALPIRLLLGVQGTAAPYKVLCGGGVSQTLPMQRDATSTIAGPIQKQQRPPQRRALHPV